MKTGLQKTVIGYEASGFGAVIILLWLYDFFFVQKYAPEIQNALHQAVVSGIAAVFIIALTVIFMTCRKTGSYRQLEGFMPVCSFCRKVREGSEWIPFEKYIEEHSDAVVSHSLCPECSEEHYGSFLRSHKNDELAKSSKFKLCRS